MNFYPYNANLKRLSRQLRGKSTDAEKLLWSKIGRKQINGYRFSRQKPIGNYIVDFYCKEAQLVIEIDGGQHYEERNIKKDKAREAFLNSVGLQVLRFTNLEVLKNLNGVLGEIYVKLNPPQPSFKKEGV